MVENGLYSEEQNRFRQSRSCSQLRFVLTTLKRNWKLQGKTTLILVMYYIIN